MKTIIYYFSGTGNSLKIAKDLAEKLDDCELVPIAKVWQKDRIVATCEKVGFIFPLYYWGLPRIVYDFIEKIELDNTNYLFAVITKDGDMDGIPLIQIERILSEKSKILSAGFFIKMPNNNIIVNDILNTEEEQKEKLEEAKKQVDNIYKIIEENKIIEIITTKKRKKTLEKLNKTFRVNVYENDRFFYADENCTSCCICEQVCPVNNIILIDGKPQWQHKCQQCLACINYCPEKSIQYGDKTLKKGRYHHPKITVKDLISQKE